MPSVQENASSHATINNDCPTTVPLYSILFCKLTCLIGFLIHNVTLFIEVGLFNGFYHIVTTGQLLDCLSILAFYSLPSSTLKSTHFLFELTTCLLLGIQMSVLSAASYFQYSKSIWHNSYDLTILGLKSFSFEIPFVLQIHRLYH